MDSDDFESDSEADSDIDPFDSDEEEEEELEGFEFQLPENIPWIQDENGEHFKRFYQLFPKVHFAGRNSAGPTVQTPPGDGKPIDFFQLFIDDGILETIKDHTNAWYRFKKDLEPNKHKVPFSPIEDIQELKAYFALLLAMNQDIDLPRHENYFRKDESKWLILTPGFDKVFTAQRFSLLNKYVFFADPGNEDVINTRAGGDKLAKVRPFVQHLQNKFSSNFNCNKNITIDEAMIPFKGRLSIKQRIVNKPVRWGIKVFELCDAETAYVSRLEVYLGKERDHNSNPGAIGKSGAVVARLTSDLNGKAHTMYIDNWYTSLALLMFLRVRDIYVCGTVRKDRKGYPSDLKDLKAKDMQRGDMQTRVFSGITALTWKDTKVVNFLSSAHGPEECATIERRQKQPTGEMAAAEIDSHKIVIDYNTNMGAIDRNDQMTLVNKSKKQMRWYMRVILKLIAISAYNAYIIHRFFFDHVPAGRRKYDFLAFREDLIMQLVGDWRAKRKKPGRKRHSTPFRLEDVGVHFPVKGEGNDHTCEVCREKRKRFMKLHPDVQKNQVPLKLTKTTFKCEACDVYLCLAKDKQCYKDFHQKLEFWRD